MQQDQLEYVGFWPRVGATLVDAIIVLVVTGPLLVAIYGWAYLSDPRYGLIAGPADFFISWVFPAIATVLFWLYCQATPGKMAISAHVVDASTGEAASVGQYVGRYLAYFVSILPLFLGVIWVALDSRKQGWHDKLANTVVIRPKNRGPQAVRFE